MNLQNGYKVIFENVADNKRTFFASKTCSFADAAQIGEEFEIGKYKLVYEKDGCVYGSESGIPSEDDVCFEAFNEVFVAEDHDAEEDNADETEGTGDDIAEEETEIPAYTNEEGPTFELPTVEEEEEV